MTDTALKEFISKQIALNGPMDVGSFMSLALAYPHHGYYMKQDPLGAEGDFTTAPEVSQMFGEMLGVWAADIWAQMGRPSRFALLECGPGRGTLCADLMRAVKGVEGFTDAAEVHLLEISPALKAKQAEALSEFSPEWHESLESVPSDVPIIVIANEFLDALPFRQLVMHEGVWRERVVDIQGGEFCFGMRDAGVFAKDAPLAAEGGVFEVSPARVVFVENVARRIEAQGGAAVFIDYGHLKTAVGDTFQAVYRHGFCGVFEHVGDADLTSHVDFEALTLGLSCGVHGPVTQGAFLRALGIKVRAQVLGEKSAAVEKDLHRLIHADEMGALFKVLGLSSFHGKTLTPAGF